MSAGESLLVPNCRNPVPPDTAWTVEEIEARRTAGDALVTRGDWAVSYDTSSETGKVARLTCVRYAPGMSLAVIERDVMDGQTFPTKDDAECYALNAGRLQWYRDWKAGRTVRATVVATRSVVARFWIDPSQPLVRVELVTMEQILVSLELNDERHVVPSDRDAESIADAAFTAFETGACSHPLFAGWQSEPEMEASIEAADAELTDTHRETIAAAHDAAGRSKVAELHRVRIAKRAV